MAASSNAWILSLKVALISTGVVSIGVMMKFSVPLIKNFAIYEIPLIWSALVSWLRPPYLYFVINFIIITIAATSRFHQSKNESEPLASPAHPQPEFGDVVSPAAYERDSVVSEMKSTLVVNGGDAEDEDDAFVITPLQRINSSDIEPEYRSPTPEKPLVSSRFGHRRPLKASPEGSRALRVAKPKRHETLENTWKTITDGRHMPLTWHLKKSDTWEHHGSQFNAVSSPLDQSPQMVKKSETLRDRTNFDPAFFSGSGKLRKEPSLSQDELNRRVEAFIKKFNDEMRLQRQESLNQYVDMINRGAH